MADSVEALLALVERHVPDRVPLPGAIVHAVGLKPAVAVRPPRAAVPVNGSVASERRLPLRRPSHKLDAATAVELDYAIHDWTPAGKPITEAPYEGYEVQSVVIDRKSTRLNSSHECASRMQPSDCKNKD